MSLNASEFTVNPNKDFTTVLKFIISMENQSLKNELHKYFGYTADCPSTASFNQRRAQIRAEAFQSLFEKFSAKYNNTTNFFNEYRLIACDGSDINIAHNPNDKESYFTNGNVQEFNQLHLNAMFDLLGKTYTDVIIQPDRLENEHKAFCDMVDRYNGMSKTIFIVDRGYESYNNLAHVVINKCTQKHVYQVNYTFAIHICRYFISKMAEKSPPDVEALIRKEIIPVRPGRHDPRKVDHKKAVSFLYRVA